MPVRTLEEGEQLDQETAAAPAIRVLPENEPLDQPAAEEPAQEKKSLTLAEQIAGSLPFYNISPGPATLPGDTVTDTGDIIRGGKVVGNLSNLPRPVSEEHPVLSALGKAAALALPALGFGGISRIPKAKPPTAQPKVKETQRLFDLAMEQTLPKAKAAEEISTFIPGKSPLFAGSPQATSALPSELSAVRVSKQATGQIAQQASEAADALARTTAATEGKRLYKQVSEAFSAGEINASDVTNVLERYKLSLPEFVEHYVETISVAGRQLQQLSTLRKRLDVLAKTSPEAKAAFERIAQNLPPGTFWDDIKRVYVAVDDVRRASLTAQAATTMRNIISQTGRYSLEALDQSLQNVIRGTRQGDALEWATAFFRNLKPGSTKRVINILEDFPLHEARLFNYPAGEVALGTKYARFINTLNSGQERFFRRAAFDATLRGELVKRGVNVTEALANPSMIPDGLIRNSVDKALEVTFAAIPKSGLGRDILRMYKAMPMLTTINPFPRFLVNSYKFLIDYSPAGIFRLLGKDAQGTLNALNSAERTKIISQASIGTMMLGGGLAIRYSELGGEKWYELKVGDKRIDTRAFAPFSTYLFFAEAIKQMAENGNLNKMTTQDLVQGFLSINRIAGTGLVALDLVREGAFDRKVQLLKDMIAQYVGGFTVPFRTIKDVVAQASPEEAKYRDVRKDVLGPTISNLPFASQTLPEQESPLRTATPKTESPLLRQATGLSYKIPNVVEKEVNRLGLEPANIFPKTGEPDIDRAISAKMGPMVESELTKLIQSPQYAGLKDDVKRVAMNSALSLLRTLARQQVVSEDPKIAARLKLKGIRKDIREMANLDEFIEQLESPQ